MQNNGNNNNNGLNNQDERLRNAPTGWDEPIDTRKLKYNYGEVIQNVDTSQFYNEDGTLKSEHPGRVAMEKEFDKRYPKINGIPVAAVKKNGDGDIIEFKLATGQLVSFDEAIRFDVDLSGMVIGSTRYGDPTVRSAPDGFKSNNLDELPEYE